jgi:hypothetical protein
MSDLQNTPRDILDSIVLEIADLEMSGLEIGEIGLNSGINNGEILDKVVLIARNPQNRALARLILACALAKTHRPELDIRKPYTEIGTADSFSGRTYDESYITGFIQKHKLPCNETTAFLTPALRNRSQALTLETNLVGRPPELYHAALQLLDAVALGHISARALLFEMILQLMQIREENKKRMSSLLAQLSDSSAIVALSSEAILNLLEQHLKLPNSSRLPVLMVAAAYQTANIGEDVLDLLAHNAADKQTGGLGDVEVVLTGEDRVVTAYEMKTRRVTREDLDIALHKFSDRNIDNYIFITTETIDPEVQEYARALYLQTGGIEVVVLDCIGFMRHYLHFFHRKRSEFLENYQKLLIAQTDSAVRPALKEAWLALRFASESSTLE